MKLFDSIKLNIRAFLLCHKEFKSLYNSIFCSEVLKTFIPYVGIYISARLIDELAGRRDPDAILGWVLASLISALVLGLLSYICERWRGYADNWEIYRITNNNIYRKKTLSMDFCVVDNQEVRELRSQIEQTDRWGAWGFNMIRFDIFPRLVRGFTSIITATVLTISLFTLQVKESEFLFLNSIWVNLTVILIMVIVILVSPIVPAKAMKFYAKLAHVSKFGNRASGYFMYDVYDKEKSLDMRMYAQEELCENYAKKYVPFGTCSPFYTFAKGKGGLMYALMEAMTATLTGVIYVFVALKALGGAFGVGLVTQYVATTIKFTQALGEILAAFSLMKTDVEFLKPSFDYLDTPNVMYKGTLTTEKRSDKKYDIEFNNVSFKYPNTDVYALKNVSVKFSIGKKMAVVGENGSGKTTFIKLLCRMYDPTEGEILLNGIDITKYNYKDYISIFSVVFQDFQLLAYSLAENVASSTKYDKATVIKCLEQAGFGERLKSMPKGIETVLYKNLDNDGVEISGGEAQKIALARALYKDAAFIILDEPTAALDPIAEAEIYEKFNEIVGDKTAVYISHRLSSCKFCDEILVFEQGRAIGQGSHSELLEKNIKYRELWNAQAQYYKEESN